MEDRDELDVRPASRLRGVQPREWRPLERCRSRGLPRTVGHRYQRMATGYAVLRLSPDSHPMQFLRPAIGEGVASSLHLRGMHGGTRADVASLVVGRQ